MGISIIICLIILAFCTVGAYKFHKDLEFCINEHFKQKRRKDWEALEESFKLQKKVEKIEWLAYGRPEKEAYLIKCGIPQETVEEYLKQLDELYFLEK